MIKRAKKILTKTIAVVLIAGIGCVEGLTIQASAAEDNSKTAVVRECDFLNMRNAAKASAKIVGRVNTGDKLSVVDTSSNGWVRVRNTNDIVGWVNGKYITISTQSNGNSNNSNTTVVSPDSKSKIESVLQLAYKQQGKPYRWGATGPSSFDCSGLTSYVYKNAANMSIPRVSRDQAKAGVAVSRASLRPGDLVFFGSGSNITHVGMYVGDSKFIHSPQTGDVVKVTRMDTGSYSRRFITARRIIQN
ncbi:MAG: C40 family peptidase [Clostridioides sp.]|nr:C40 family peptidase [Clostridioides sp.]